MSYDLVVRPRLLFVGVAAAGAAFVACFTFSPSSGSDDENGGSGGGGGFVPCPSQPPAGLCPVGQICSYCSPQEVQLRCISDGKKSWWVAQNGFRCDAGSDASEEAGDASPEASDASADVDGQ